MPTCAIHTLVPSLLQMNHTLWFQIIFAAEDKTRIVILHTDEFAMRSSDEWLPFFRLDRDDRDVINGNGPSTIHVDILADPDDQNQHDDVDHHSKSIS